VKANLLRCMSPDLALTDDYAMSALTVALWGKPDQICSMRDFLRMTPQATCATQNFCSAKMTAGPIPSVPVSWFTRQLKPRLARFAALGEGMRRRDFIKVIAGSTAAWPLTARAQSKRRIPKVGVLWHAASAEDEEPLFTALVEGFRALGYIDGQTIILEHRFPNEVPQRFKSMAAELVSLNVDVLVSSGNNAAPYAKNATTSIPVVAMFISDPVGTKLVESLARPGGNVTGLSFFSAELIGKRLQFLKEVVPGLSRVAQLVNPLAQISRLYVDLTQTAANQLGLTVERFEARSREEIEPAFAAMAKAGMQALITNADGLAFAQRELIGQLALKTRLPAAVFMREVLMPGTLLSYGPDSLVICRRAAVYVDRILKGEKPSELPVEQPTKSELVINLKTAEAIGITVPPLLLNLANEVIE
jgi:putative ABC transport system substrate-binding protein